MTDDLKKSYWRLRISILSLSQLCQDLLVLCQFSEFWNNCIKKVSLRTYRRPVSSFRNMGSRKLRRFLCAIGLSIIVHYGWFCCWVIISNISTWTILEYVNDSGKGHLILNIAFLIFCDHNFSGILWYSCKK